MNTDELAQVLAEHDIYSLPRNLGQYRSAYDCTCGQEVITDVHRGISRPHAFAAHVAAVVLAHLTAEGWAQGREEFATKDGEDEGVTEIEPPTREWAERVAAADNAYLRRTGFEPNITVVRRRVTDWEEA